MNKMNITRDGVPVSVTASVVEHSYRQTRRGGRRCLVRDDGKVIFGTAQDLREEDGANFEREAWARHLRDRRKIARMSLRNISGYTRKDYLEAIAGARRDCLFYRQGEKWNGYGLHTPYTRHEREAIFREAKSQGIDESELVRRAVREYIDRTR